MLERCLGSEKSFKMLLPSGFPKGKRGVEWVSALAGRLPQLPFFPQPLPKGGMLDVSNSGQSVTHPEADSIIPQARLPSLQCLPLCAALQCSADLVVNY